jgi:ABC-2 type transport system permease protein
MSTSPANTGMKANLANNSGGRGPLKHVRDFWWLLRSDLFLLREEWFWYFVQASFVPVTYLFFLWLLAGRHNPAAMTFVVTGSLVMSLSFGGMISLGQHLGMLKNNNAFEYYATLPIAKAVFLAAITTRGMLLTLPSTIVVLALGHLVFGIGVSALGLIVLVLSAYALAGFGAIIGFWSPTAQVASLATQVLGNLIIFFGPIFYPLAILPRPLQWIAHLWPTTYAAEALRDAVQGAPPARLALPLAVLVGFVCLSLVLVPLKLDWRGR